MKKSAKKKPRPHDPVTSWIVDCYRAGDWPGTLNEINTGLSDNDSNPALLWLR